MRKTEQAIVLVAVAGTSPAVITETIWALAHETPALLPDQVVVLTTRTGKERLIESVRSLGQDGSTVWDQLVQALEKEFPGMTAGKLAFGETSVRVCPDERRNEAADLRSVDDNRRMADFILEELRKYTEDSSKRVIASIAGGRKTMSALMLSCMSLLGRDCDRVTHVLVNPPFDTRLEPPFYFPREGLVHRDGQGGDHPSSDASVDLFDVPFVRMRGWYYERFQKLPPSYSVLVSNMQEIAPKANVYPRIEINVRKGTLLIDEQEIELSGCEFATLLFLAKGHSDFDTLLHLLYGLKFFHGEGLVSIGWLQDVKETDRLKKERPKPFGKDDRQELSKVLSSLRIAIRHASPATADALVPLRGKAVTFPSRRIVWKEAKWFEDIRGYLLSRHRS